MDEIAEFVDERQKSWCIHCARPLSSVKQTRDHIPTKTLLHLPFPRNMPIVHICAECNHGFSKDERYLVALLGAVVSGSTDPDAQVNSNAARILRNDQIVRSDVERGKKEYKTIGGEARVLWSVNFKRVKTVVVKNARGHLFFEYGEPMLREPLSVSVIPLNSMTGTERDDFEKIPEDSVWPEVGSRMMTRMMTGQDLDGSWIVVQPGVYRYSVAQHDGDIMVRSVMSEYLATEVSWE